MSKFCPLGICSEYYKRQWSVRFHFSFLKPVFLLQKDKPSVSWKQSKQLVLSNSYLIDIGMSTLQLFWKVALRYILKREDKHINLSTLFTLMSHIF